jgi:hypothetical protein
MFTEMTAKVSRASATLSWNCCNDGFSLRIVGTTARIVGTTARIVGTTARIDDSVGGDDSVSRGIAELAKRNENSRISRESKDNTQVDCHPGPNSI